MPALTANKPNADELRALYVDQRLSTRQIGGRYGVRHITIRRWLAAAGIEPRAATRGLENRGVEAPTRDELADLVHVQHLGYRAIADRYGVDHTAVPYWLDAHGIARPSVWQTRRAGVEVVVPSAALLAAEYAAGASTARIGRVHGVSATTAGEWLREAGVKLREDGWNGGRRFACVDGHAARSEYEQRVDDWLTAHQLAHDVEPRLPFDRRCRADFLVGGTYIEVWGVTGSASYDAQKRRKTALYQEYGLPLLGLHPWQFSRKTWARKLAQLAASSTPRG